MKSTVMILALFAIGLSSFCQTKLEEDLKKIVLDETEYYRKGDSIKWASFFSHDDKVFRYYTGNGFHASQVGWKNFGPYIIEWMREGPISKNALRIQHENFVIRTSGDLSWMTYEQKSFYRDKDSLPVTNTLETRTLLREKGVWKIISIGTIDSLSYNSTKPSNVENLFNSTGYAYMNAKKYKEAIEVFKLNVTLFPDSWNVYDSLGEAYAADGNKDLAIKNYERSIELNPKNDSGVEILKKLKGE
ncbi:tetratricopeptide repeat protein [Flavitalea sp.]|nr:tetratricopeptide repeat protein [Flavitalea sp.]